MEKTKIVFFTNPGVQVSFMAIKKLVEKGENVAAVFSSSYRQESGKSAPDLIREYGVPFLASKALGMIRLKFTKSGMPKYLEEKNIPHHVVGDINSGESVELIKSLAPDIIVVSTFSQILCGRVIGVPKTACINAHNSLLPKYRGPYPVFWALYHGEEKTGVTVHFVNTGIDDGDIILQKEVEIRRDDTIVSLEERIVPVAAQAIEEAIDLLKAGEASGRKQPCKGEYYRRPGRKDWKRFNEIMRGRSARR